MIYTGSKIFQRIIIKEDSTSFKLTMTKNIKRNAIKNELRIFDYQFSSFDDKEIMKTMRIY